MLESTEQGELEALRPSAGVDESATPEMYEENLKPLPAGDFAKVFADQLDAIDHGVSAHSPARITPADVVQWARPEIQPHLAAICRRLLLPGSVITGVEHLIELTQLAQSGKSCLICLNHRSNLDVPTLHVLLEDQFQCEAFHRTIWIAGRKLSEDAGATRLLVQAYNRIVVSPRSWMDGEHSNEELHEAHQINLAALRAIHKLRYQGWVFALFPGGTRIRPQDASTREAIPETDSYLKHFTFMVLGRIDGCTLPVSRDHDLTHETPTLNQVRFTFGAVRQTRDWRAHAASRFAGLNQRAASARAIIEDIAEISPA